MTRLPLNEIQRAYLAGSRFELGDVPARYVVEADAAGLDLERLRDALQRVVERHEILRCVFHADGTQELLPEVSRIEIACTDLRACADADRRLAASHAELLSHRTPAGTWPSLELRAHLLPGDVTRLQLAIDLIVMDAASMIAFNRELRDLYLDPSLEPEPVPLAFADYRRAELAALSEALRERGGARDEVAPPPDLPLAAAPATIRDHRFVSHRTGLDADEWAALAAWAAGARLTPSALVAGAYAWALGSWARSPRFCLSLTTHGRLPVHQRVHELLGPFTSLALVDVDVSDGDSFTAFARRLQSSTWRAARSWRTAGVTRAGEIALRNGMRGAAAPVVLTCVLGDAADTALLAGVATPVSSVMQTPQVWLEHQVFEQAGGLALQHNTVDTLLCDGVAEELLEAEAELLRGLAHRAGFGDGRPALVPVAHGARHEGANATDADLPVGLLHEPFDARARAHPDAIAVASPAGTVTYGELRERALALGGQLRAAGARAEALVAIVAPKGAEQVVAALAVHYAGAAYLPVDPALPAARREALLRQGAVALAVTTPALARELEWPAGVTGVVEGAEPVGPVVPPVPSGPTALAYVIPTSGSTGEPKGVAVEHRAARNTVEDVTRRIGLAVGDAVLGLSALSFDLSVFDVFGTLGAGATLVLPDPARAHDPAHWAALCAEHGVTVWNSVPALLRLAVEHARRRGGTGLERLRVAMLSGDWIPVGLPGELMALAPGCRVASLGGATEAAIWSIWHDVGPEPRPGWTSVPYGRPMANQSFHVLDDELRERPDFAVGHLHIGGAGLARGYWRDEERTAAAFITHPRTGERLYRTGDLGRWRPDGLVELLGREDSQVKVQGFRIELAEVELALESHPAVGRAVAAVLGDAGAERRLVAYLTGDAAPQPADLRAWMADRLPGYMVPSAFVTLDALPLTANGKVDRGALPAPAARAAARPAPEGTGCEVAALVARVLEIDHVAPDDDLVTLGATSLDLVRLADALEDELGRRPAFERLFAAPTVAALARCLQDEDAGAPVPAPGLVVRRPVAAPELRVVCIPGAGMGAQAFAGWPDLVPAGVELLAAQLPGRGARSAEAPLAGVEAMAEDVLAALGDRRDVPLVLVGHSMGALVAFELAARLQGAATVERLVVAAATAPGVPRPPAVVHELDDAGLAAELERLGRLPASLAGRPDVLRLLMPTLRADLEAVEAYRPAAPAVLACPVIALSGEDDELVAVADVAAWDARTTGTCLHRTHPGGHLFVLDDPTPVIAELSGRAVVT